MHQEVVKIGGSFILDDLFEITALQKTGSSVTLGIHSVHGGTPRIKRIAPRPASVEQNLTRYQRMKARAQKRLTDDRRAE